VAVSTTTVQPENIAATIDVTGSLSPLPGAEARVAPVAPGRVQQVFVANGSHVVRGQVLATLAAGPLVGQAQQAEAAVNSAQASVQQARANYSATVSQNSAAVQAAQTNLSQAQVALQKVLAGSRSEEIDKAQADVTAAQAGVANSQANIEREQRLFTAGVVARKDVEAAQLQLATSQAALNSARLDLRLKEKPNRPQDLAAARLAVQQARDQLSGTLAAQEQNRVRAGDVAVASQQLAGARGALTAAEAQLSAQQVCSPVSGVVMQRLVNPGEYVDTTGAICTVADLSQVRVILQVPSAQVGSVALGDSVRFKPDSQPNHTYEATVDLIGKNVDPTSNAVSVEARVNNLQGLLRDDGFVHASIVTRVQPSVLAVPTSSIVLVSGKPTVFVVSRDNIAHAHPVTQGIRQGDRMEITSGISAGDHVVTSGAYELSDGTKVKLMQPTPAPGADGISGAPQP
jgi:HlyD family secretion protein